MILLEDMTTEELQIMRSKWVGQNADLEKERDRKQKRLESRLESQDDEAGAQADKIANLEHAQSMLALAVSSNAGAAAINRQQALVDSLQEEVDDIGLSTSYVSKTDARQVQMELDELDFAISQRALRITEIDAELA